MTTDRSKLFIGTELVDPLGTDRLTIASPMTEEVVGSSPAASEADVDRAVAAAREAFDHGPWPSMDPEERREILRRAGKILEPRAAELTELIVRQNGTPSRFQPGNSQGAFEYFTSLRMPSPRLGESSPGNQAVVVHEPVGVVGVVIPWNWPIGQGLSKALPALLAGNCVIVKQSPETPLQDEAVGEAFIQAGLPKGVLTIIAATSGPSEYLVGHPGVDMVSFTGSTEVGRRVGSICGGQIKRALLELGGKSAAIVLDDADFGEVAPTVLNWGVLLLNGQACSAWSRILVPRNRYDEAVDAFADVMSSARVGDPLDPETEVGPLVTSKQRDRVEGLIASGVAEGAQIKVGGVRPAGYDKGWFVEPTLFVEANNAMRIAREEIFGPVALLLPYEDEDDAVNIANASTYGLAGGVFTKDPARGAAVGRRIRSGAISVNCFSNSDALPFGGYKDSGVGRVGGPEGFAEFFETKAIGFAGAVPELLSPKQAKGLDDEQ
ncbi:MULTISPECIES: aldehyde dehydrogenase family protein [unclassified Pseudofrankia]|uniref:aldehyde dehydrogenase family protein n=1 Tax=unclassified Pseudofrankia TaxID=2994372 RepID=UPI0008D9EB60|nr:MULTISPECIES: aldehyde dehydrogenase family protein [unclassified Pseudofrankia]MDT3445611.1 aldehyde dehydrogenase family protein [Pseudofrankia sp. BMG5.37]OHV63540.1 hypothetical protein BCD48_38105 [Pseudofrankia sp. BMG5.36]